MANIQSLFPVYLPHAKPEDQTTEDYDAAVSTNENNLNQNLRTLYNEINNLSDTVSRQQAVIDQQDAIIHSLQQGV